MSDQCKVAIIEDCEFDLFHSTRVLQKNIKSLELKTFNSGGLFLKLLDEGYKPDLLLLDMNTPGVNGFELLESLNQRGIHNLNILVMASSVTHQEIIEEKVYYKLDYIMKPISFKGLIAESIGNA